MHTMCYIYYVHFIFVGKTRLAQGTVINYVHNYLLYVRSTNVCYNTSMITAILTVADL